MLKWLRKRFYADHARDYVGRAGLTYTRPEVVTVTLHDRGASVDVYDHNSGQVWLLEITRRGLTVVITAELWTPPAPPKPVVDPFIDEQALERLLRDVAR